MKKILTLLLLSLRICMYAQGYTAEYAIGYGNYQLNDIKSIQKSMVGNYGLKITDCFPGYYTHTVTIDYYRDWETDRKSTRLNSSHRSLSRMPSSA